MIVLHIDRREQHVITAEILDPGEGKIFSRFWQKSCEEEGYYSMDSVFDDLIFGKRRSDYSKAKMLDSVFDIIDLGKNMKYQTDYLLLTEDGEAVAIVDVLKTYAGAEKEKLNGLSSWAIEKGEF